MIDSQQRAATIGKAIVEAWTHIVEAPDELLVDSLVKTRFEEVPAISHICALPYVGVVYGTEAVYCTPARVRLFYFGLHRLFTRESWLT